MQSSKKSYQTLETYGDTVLKIAATLLSYRYCLQYEKDVDENKIDQLKIAFITNLYFLRIGKRLGLNRYIRTSDPDLKSWSPPFSEQVAVTETVNCTGKNIADVVESLIGAHFMTNNLRKTMQLISDMRIMPLKQAGVLEMIPDDDLTFKLHADIDEYGFDMADTVEDIFRKYFHIHDHIEAHVIERI
jgi:dsRNA-specific ribonuclease